MLFAELSARGIDVRTQTAAHRRVDAALGEPSRKRVGALAAPVAIARLFDFVYPNQIDMNRDLSECAAQGTGERVRVLGAVVLPRDPGVFKGDAPSRLGLIIGAGGEQRANGIDFVYRHNPGARLVGRGVQGDR